MSSAKYIEPKEVTQIPEPAITRFLFGGYTDGLAMVDCSPVCWL